MGKVVELRRRYGGSSIPFKRVEYIGTNGWVAFNTGYVPNGENIRIKAKFLFRGYLDATEYISWYWAYTSEEKSAYRIIKSGGVETKVWWDNGHIGSSSKAGTDYNVTHGGLYDIESNGNSMTINGVIKIRSMQLAANTGSLNVMSSLFSGRCYYFKVYDNDILRVDLVPVTDKGIGCFYDTVSRSLILPIGVGDTFTDEGIKDSLPDGYTAIEYIERGKNNAYINTGYTLDFSEKVEMKMNILEWGGSYSTIFGNYSNEDSNCTRAIRDGNNNNGLLVGYNRKAGGGMITVPMVLGQPFVLSLSDSKYIFNGVSYTPSQRKGYDYNGSLKLFSGTNTRGRIYYLKIGDKRHFVPCISPRGNVGLFELKEGIFYRGNNSTNFIAGPVINN